MREDAGSRWITWLGVMGLVALAVALLTRSALAQEVEPFDLVGTVVGDAGQPLVGAFVSFAGADWGSITNEDGRFRIPDVDPGQVALEVEQLGYATLTWSGTVGPDLGPLTLQMEAQPIMLEGLNVVTDRFQARRNAAATTVQAWDRTDLSTSMYRTAAEFVESRAGITPTPCRGSVHASVCIWSRGRAVAPVVYVDEFPVFGGMAYLDAMQPHELYMVEVYGHGRHIRVYTERFMKRAAKTRLQPVSLLW
jgi:hypothetical protein